MTTTYKGQCLCGAVEYEVDEFSPKMAHCHCSMCRKFHGAAFATYGTAKKSAFRWLRGKGICRPIQPATARRGDSAATVDPA